MPVLDKQPGDQPGDTGPTAEQERLRQQAAELLRQQVQTGGPSLPVIPGPRRPSFRSPTPGRFQILGSNFPPEPIFEDLPRAVAEAELLDVIRGKLVLGGALAINEAQQQRERPPRVRIEVDRALLQSQAGGGGGPRELSATQSSPQDFEAEAASRAMQSVRDLGNRLAEAIGVKITNKAIEDSALQGKKFASKAPATFVIDELFVSEAATGEEAEIARREERELALRIAAGRVGLALAVLRNQQPLALTLVMRDP